MRKAAAREIVDFLSYFFKIIKNYLLFWYFYITVEFDSLINFIIFNSIYGWEY
ncbi:hypothetical protein LEP1GSC047_4021 [Leptospira inadai serovar Lyme str. 10]|uniref:Uncharacterized protein n=1 Tax=Leptospira inadai serovar Lyme str. 10 TaxID=1049790 RepID=V6HDB2_9LEPT|nr:hypothetical protein LEP1GSC047_4021 [Leptospira inadai serovar Lyme str. 10]